MPEHSHRAQWELVIAGKSELKMKGEARTYQQGDSFFIPEGVEHGADPDIENQEGLTAVAIARKRRHAAVLEAIETPR